MSPERHPRHVLPPPEKKVFNAVFPLWKEGKTAKEIEALTGYKPGQTYNALASARRRQEIDTPSPKEKYTRWKNSNAEKPSPKKGKLQSVNLTLRVAEGTKGKKLTPLEREHIRLTNTARRVPIDRGRRTLAAFFATNQVPLRVRHRDKRFLEMYYAARLCFDDKDLPNPREVRQRSFVRVADVVRIYEQVDPKVFERRKDDIAFIDAGRSKGYGALEVGVLIQQLDTLETPFTSTPALCPIPEALFVTGLSNPQILEGYEPGNTRVNIGKAKNALRHCLGLLTKARDTNLGIRNMNDLYRVALKRTQGR